MSKKLPSISDRTDWQGVRVLVRGSLDVPVFENEVQNEFRLERTIDTVKYLCERGARVVLFGHIGREPDTTLYPVYRALHNRLPNLGWCPALTGTTVASAIATLTDGQALLLENTRSDERELKNDATLARIFAQYADVYVHSAFSVAHREQASTYGVAQLLPAYAGLNFLREFEELSKALVPNHPALFVLGGAKFDTKLPLVEKFLDLYDEIFIGGALANDFFKAHGYEVGSSLVSEIDLHGSPLLAHPKVLLPLDVLVKSPAGQRTCLPAEVQHQETILDVGPRTTAMLATRCAQAQTILWNGPLGNYEAGFVEATEAVARAIAASNAYSVIGGGDTVAAIESLSLGEQFSFLSTAGGAMLTFLERGTLPGIEAIRNAPATKQL